MNIIQNVSLLNYNTFKIKARAKYIVEIESIEDFPKLTELNELKDHSIYILGGGSNILFTNDVKGILLHSVIKEIGVINETIDYVDVGCGSGVNWDYFVNYCVERNWGGIENLSDIPGNVGAAPVQNIGAYGVEAKDTILQVEGIDYTNGIPFKLSNTECCFAYRNSIFKKKPNLFISHVIFRLSKKHKLIANYGKVEEELNKISDRNIAGIRQVITKIRQSKLPSTEEFGSAGSFFKNPIINNETLVQLCEQYPDIPMYNQETGKTKISAAWLIDNAKLKGVRQGSVGTYKNQPLVIVNYGGATGEEVLEFAENIQQKVFDKFKIWLEPEVIIK